MFKIKDGYKLEIQTDKKKNGENLQGLEVLEVV